LTIPLRQQLLLGALLLVSTAVGIRNIAAARNEGVVGGRVHRLDPEREAEGAAFRRLLSDVETLGHPELASRLRALEAGGALWVAPALDPGHWALYVDTFRLVRRVYVRETALLSPEAHLFPQGEPSLRRENRQAFARVSLAGALYHELQHWDGIEDEAAAYDLEIAWLLGLRPPEQAAMSDEERRALEWGIESAVLSARKARALATGTSPAP
jgi:hypothetical protein